jgi:hypothetical protein
MDALEIKAIVLKEHGTFMQEKYCLFAACFFYRSLKLESFA